MTQSLTHSFSLDAKPLRAAIAELSFLAERSEQVREALGRLIESGEQLFSLQNDLGAAPVAGVTVICANPSDRLRRFLAAARAGDVDALLVKNVLSHDSSSVGCFGDSNEERAPAESQGSVGACAHRSQDGEC